MSGWKVKRFWKETAVAEAEGGFTVTLDGKPIRTPAKAPLTVPTRAFAEAIAEEWAAQADEIRPETMPLTRSANAAIDKVTAQFDEVAALIVAYGETDLLCYRAEGPESLVRRQAEAWDPLLDWAAGALGARLHPVAGIMHQPQEAAALAALTEATRAFSAFELAAFHDLVALSGSLILAFAAARGARRPEALWEVSQVDEEWQAGQWGKDDQACANTALKRQAFLDAARVFSLLGQS
ncbi:MAG: ATPase [Rhodobacterales bacterium]|nr:MAG: ATPase [Rhodobacterales bacterium]